MEKIKEKLTGHSSSNSNKLEKQNPDSSTTGSGSKLQHPISNSEGGTYGTYGSNNESYGSNTGSSGIESGRTYPQTTSGHTATASDRMPGGYVDEDSHAPTHDTYSSSNTPNKPYDPYSKKGQQTAASGGTTGYGSSQSENYGRSTAEDSSLSRSREGGILNHSTDHQHSSHHGSSHAPAEQRYESHQPTTGQQYDPSHTSSHDHTSSSHYGRDAAMAGGVGAGGVGAYELGKNNPSSQPLTQDASYNQQSQHGGQYDHSLTGGAAGYPSSGHSSSGVTESAGLTQAKKMGGAYEAGYRDAIEHMKAEMGQQGSGKAF